MWYRGAIVLLWCCLCGLPAWAQPAPGVLGKNHGGTGLSSYTLGDLIYGVASATPETPLGKLADVAVGSHLSSGGVGGAPAWTLSPWLQDGINTYLGVQRNVCVGTGPTATDALSLCTAPVASATRALLNLSNTVLSGGSAAGTYIGANPAACTGNFLDLQLADAARAKLTCAGALTVVSSTNNLSIFAATTSAQLAGVLSDETGTGLAVFNAAPTITNPIITNIAPGANFTLTQNSVVPFTSVNAGAIANTLYIAAGQVAVGTIPTAGGSIFEVYSAGADSTITENLHFNSGHGTSRSNSLTMGRGAVGAETGGNYNMRLVGTYSSVNDNSSTAQLQTHATGSGVWNVGLFIDAGGKFGLGTITPIDEVELAAAWNLRIPNIKSVTGVRYICADTNGRLTSQAAACVGT